MKEEAPLGNPFIGELRVADRPRMVAGQPAHVASAPKLCPKGVVVELKGKILEGKGGKEGEGGRPTTIFDRPTMLGIHSIPTFILHVILLLSCSLH
jgi:hypothetical protein